MHPVGLDLRSLPRLQTEREAWSGGLTCGVLSPLLDVGCPEPRAPLWPRPQTDGGVKEEVGGGRVFRAAFTTDAAVLHRGSKGESCSLLSWPDVLSNSGFF